MGKLLLEVFPVLTDVFPPLRWNGEFVENCIDGTGRFTVRAVDTRFGIDVEHVVGIGGKDAIDGADFHTGSVFDPFTRFGYYVRHPNLFFSGRG